MFPSNFQGGGVGVPRVPFLVIIIIVALIANENGWMMMTMVEGRTWPRLVQPEEGFHHKVEIYSTSSTRTASLKKDYNTSPSSILGSGESVVTAPKREINSSLSPILPSPLHLEKAKEDDADNNSSSSSSYVSGDYQDFNGNVSLRCNRRPRHHYYHHLTRNNSSNGNNDHYNGDGSWRWTSNSTNCLAGPFHLGADVNESVYNALCPLSASATNGKFSIQGLHCENDDGDWFIQCSRNDEQGTSIFTLHKCDDGESFFDSESGGECARESEKGKIKTSGTACPLDRDDEIFSDDKLLQWVLLEIMSPAHTLIPEESKVRGIVQDLQSLEDFDSETNNDGNYNHLQNLCKSTYHNHGLHPHPHLCTKYIHCTPEGSFVLKDCGPGTVFNPELFICDWPANVPQCSSTSSTGNENDVVRRRRKAEISSETKKRNKCNFTGIQPDPQYCNKYILCSSGGVESVHTCGLGTVFNSLSGVCDFADEVDCSSRKSDLDTYGCDKGDKYRAPHPDYCNKFLECEGATLAVKSCPPGTLYDREAETCDHAFKVTCRKKISLEHDTDVNWKSHGHDDGGESETVILNRKRRSAISSAWRRTERTARNNNNNQLNLACEFNYIAPHPHSCNRFVECEDGRIYIKTCGPGTAFNPILGQCDWPHNVREPDERDCTRYRQCSLRNGYQPKSCPPGQYFNEETRRCVNGTPYQIQRCSNADPRVPITTTTRRTIIQPPIFVGPPPS